MFYSSPFVSGDTGKPREHSATAAPLRCEDYAAPAYMLFPVQTYMYKATPI